MSKIELPPLPQPAKCWPYEPVDGTMYTADQLRARDRQIVEVCAQICRRRVTNEPGLQREDYESRQCAAAIRNLIEESNNG